MSRRGATARRRPSGLGVVAALALLGALLGALGWAALRPASLPDLVQALDFALP